MTTKLPIETIYVYLPEEAIDTWRPVKAEKLEEGVYRIIEQEYPRDIEKWEFEPGEVVLCKFRDLAKGVDVEQFLVAYKRA